MLFNQIMMQNSTFLGIACRKGRIYRHISFITAQKFEYDMIS